MSDCTHLYAPCSDCTSYIYRASEITNKQTHHLGKFRWFQFFGLTVAFILCGASAIWCAAEIVHGWKIEQSRQIAEARV